mgnify:CR=1 FL=1
MTQDIRSTSDHPLWSRESFLVWFICTSSNNLFWFGPSCFSRPSLLVWTIYFGMSIRASPNHPNWFRQFVLLRSIRASLDHPYFSRSTVLVQQAWKICAYMCDHSTIETCMGGTVLEWYKHKQIICDSGRFIPRANIKEHAYRPQREEEVLERYHQDSHTILVLDAIR